MTTRPPTSSGTRQSTAEPAPSLSDLHFWLNGHAVTLTDVNPAVLLVDYLRSAPVGLTGTKIGCKQGGCGACTVLLSQFDAATRQVSHRSVNACMRPLASLDGAAVTTVEGMGSVSHAVSPVQYALAKNNGTQCGYCTPGMVMSAHGCLAARGVESLAFDTRTDRVEPADPGLARLPTRAEWQQRFDGNICRCTGYRPILFGLEKGFARDWTPADAKGSMRCMVDPAEKVALSQTITPPFPPALKVRPRPVHYARGGYTWDRAASLADLKRLLRKYPAEPDRKLVFGNTSVGVYDRYTENPHHLIDIAHVAELRATRATARGLRVGAAVTYNDFLDLLDARIADAQGRHLAQVAGLTALRYLAGRTAGAIVRDAASLGGNTMLVLRHINDGVPFPSDLFTALAAAGTRVHTWNGIEDRTQAHDLLAFADHYATSGAVRDQCLLLGYDIPHAPPGTFSQTYKTALREVNAHAIVNAGFQLRFDTAGCVEHVRLVMGGLAPCAVALESVEAALRGKPWTWATGAAAQAALNTEIDALFARHAQRFAGLPFEGFTNAYRRQLAASFLYKFFVEVAQAVAPDILTPDILSAATRTQRGVSAGTQSYASNPALAPVNQPYVKLDAFLQASGEALYPQDQPLPQRGLEAAYAFSTRARAKFHYRLPGRRGAATAADVLEHLQAVFPGIMDYLTEADMPRYKGKSSNNQGLAKDQPVFAPKRADGHSYEVQTDGQSLGLVLATESTVALDAAHYLSHQLVAYTDERRPLLGIAQAVAAGSVFADFPPGAPWMSHVWQVIRPGTRDGWQQAGGDGAHGVVDGLSCRFVSGGQSVGGQVHFYMETQTCQAVPGEEGRMVLRASTQDADQVQAAVAGVLGLPMNLVDVRIKRIGGGYGGKCNPPVFVAIAAALAARKHQRAIRLAVKREVDSAMFGHRHPAQGQFTVAIGDGSDNPANKGRLVGLQNDFYLDGGWSYDCSMIVSDCLQLRVDSAYFVPNYGTTSDVCRTNTASNTAFRTMGMIQGVLMQEEAIERAAHAIGMRPEDVRAMNLYRAGQQTPFGQVLPGCYIGDVFEHTRKTYRFDERLAAVNTFNAANRWRKRGLSLIPVKYGSGFNLPMLEQAGAQIEVFDQDGSVLLRTGGVEMGQGLNTKVALVAAYYLGVSPQLVRVAELDTAVVPNPSASGASTGSSFNAAAVAKCAQDLCARLIAFCVHHNTRHPPPTPQLAYPDSPGQPWPPGAWAQAVAAAQRSRVNLSSQQRVAIPGGSRLDGSGLFFHDAPPPNKPTSADELNYNFTGYTYSAAIAEVEIDVLTGETAVLQADIVYDMGLSQNPAIDVGQVEGAFVQGIGYVMYEERVYQPEGTPLPPGVLNTTNTWNYKPPAVTSIPLQMNVELYQHPSHPGTLSPDNPVRSSKEVGEPPMTLAATVFFAIKHAVHAARADAGDAGWFDLPVPATVQRVAQACRAGATP